MTKEEAIKLEERCDELMSRCLDRSCMVSLALSGKFKIAFDDGDYITWDMDCNDASYIQYHGSYDTLVWMIEDIREIIDDNRDIFNNLIWSYEHRRELE